MASSGTISEAMRQRLHGMWASVAPSWDAHAGYVEVSGAPLAEAMLAAVAPRPGDRVLELACGAGDVGLAAARLVAPGGAVLLSDVAPEMTAIAAARAAARALDNVEACPLDIEQIDLPDESYDAVVCREGLMFAFAPERAAAEIRRVLRPGGRVALAVWGPRERNPWLGLIFDAVGEQLGAPVPPPGIPGPFSLGDSERLADVLRSAGLCDVVVDELTVPRPPMTFEEWWTRTTALAGPLAAIVASFPEEAARAVRVRLMEAVRPWETESGLAFTGVSLLARARRD